MPSTRMRIALTLPSAASLGAYEVEDDDVRSAVDALEQRGIGYGSSGFRSGTTLSDLPLHARAQVARSVVHAARVAVATAVRSSSRSSA